jgi:hypothetical protein
MKSYYCLLGCHTVSFGSSLLMFQRNLSSIICVNGQTVYTDTKWSVLMTEALAYSETSATCHQTTWCHIQGDNYIHCQHHRNRNFYRHRTVITSKAEKQKVVLYHKLIAERDRNISKTMWNASNIWRHHTLIICVHISSYIYYLKFYS